MSASKPHNEAAQGTSENMKRGRVIPSRYMNATASSRAAATSKATSTRLKPSSATLGFAKGGPAVSARSSQPASTSSDPKRKAASSQPSNVANLHGPKQNAVDASVGARSSDVQFDVASQLYPWLFMRHTLSESSNVAATQAEAALIVREKELAAEEEALANDRMRCQAARETRLIDELSHERICREAPLLIRKFVQSHSRCQEAVSHAVRITSSHDNWDVKITRTRLRDLEQFSKDSLLLRKAFAELAHDLPPDSLVAFTLAGLLRSLDARIENLQMSQQLLIKMRDNFMTACHLDSLSIRDL